MSKIETITQQRPPTQVVTSLRADVVEGPDRGAHAVGGDTLSVGTASDNELVLGDFTVSRYHLEVVACPGGILLTDLGSRNGTYVGALRIERAFVPPRTRVTLGGTSIQFEDAVRQASPAPLESRRCAGMIARSPAMLKLFGDIERVAATSSSVLIVGESGTGKEGVAEAVHEQSTRRDEPLVTIDCGSLTSTLLTSELFGHERGAFTGADRAYPGAFERAGAGTVFLDEIGELSPADQAALLGVLERRRFRRVGGATELELRARVLAATNRDLRADVNSGRFRADLYHRLAVVTLRLLPLRERPEDILPLIEHFGHELGAAGPLEALLGSDTLARWQERSWPGNVRELRNAVEAALVVGPDFESALPGAGDPERLQPYKAARAVIVGEFERDYLTRLIAQARGNVSLAARIANMDRSHLIDLLQRHGLKGDAPRSKH